MTAHSSTDTADLVRRLENDLLTAHIRWLFYLQIFKRKEDRAIVENYLGNFGAELVELLIDDLFLRLARITDPAFSNTKSGKVENLTIDLVCHRIETTKGPSRIKWIKRRIAQVKTDVQEIRRHRDKRLAHSDVQTRLGHSAPLHSIPRNSINKIFRNLERIVQHFNRRIGRSRFFISSLVLKGDGSTLLWHLYRLEAVNKEALKNDAVMEALNSVRTLKRFTKKRVTRGITR